VTPAMFRKCGAFTYQRAQHSWAREARATIAWTNKSYENRSRAARAIEEEFSTKLLPEGIDYQLVPNIDDVMQCPELAQDFGEFTGPEVSAAFAAWQVAYGEYFKTPVSQRKPALMKVVKAFQECTSIYTHLQPLQDVFQKECTARGKITDSCIMYCTAAGIRATAQKYLLRWLVEHNMKWKSVPWSPVSTVMFSDITMAYGMGTIEKMIEEEALKGKSGLSKLMAKRQVKKHSVANVRTAPAKELSNTSDKLFATGSALDMMSFGKDFGKAGGAKEWTGTAVDEFTLAVPSFAETLSSAYLRKFFGNNFLGSVAQTTEVTLFNALSEFYGKYSMMTSEKLYEAQGEMRKDIEAIVEKYHSVFKDPAAIREQAKTDKVIFPQFFRPYEMEMFASAHEAFEKALQQKGWC